MTTNAAKPAFALPAFLGSLALIHVPCCGLPIAFAVFGAQLLPFHNSGLEWALAIALPVVGKALADRLHGRAHAAARGHCGHVCADHRQPALKKTVSYAAWVALSLALMTLHGHFLHI